MTILVTPDEMRAAERAVVEAGRPEPELMRTAAEQIADWIDRLELPEAPRSQRLHVVALVGPGNNGGDALVTLALLGDRGWRTTAVLLGRSELGELPASPESLARIELAEPDVLFDATLILDGVYGIGSRAEIPANVADAFSHANDVRISRGTPLIAIDVPSGVDAGTGAASDDAFRADVTLCLGLPKIGLTREPAASKVGELVLLDIGIPIPGSIDTPNRPRLIDSTAARVLVPRRGASTHKSQTGTLLVVAGAPAYYGAPRMCGAAALRAGAGLVALGVPASLAPTIAGAVPELVMIPLSEHDSNQAVSAISAFAEQRASTLRGAVIGPGLGAGKHVDALLETLIGSDDTPAGLKPLQSLKMVIDADGLNWIARRGRWPEKLAAEQGVLTPHAGELSRLLNVGIDDIIDRPWEMARRAARESGQIVVLKLGYTTIARPTGEISIAHRAAPELATAGTGDVLAGLIGGFLAQGVAPWDAARLAVHVGAETGRRARQQYGTLSVVASDIIDGVSGVLRELSEPRMHVHSSSD